MKQLWACYRQCSCCSLFLKNGALLVNLDFLQIQVWHLTEKDISLKTELLEFTWRASVRVPFFPYLRHEIREASSHFIIHSLRIIRLQVLEACILVVLQSFNGNRSKPLTVQGDWELLDALWEQNSLPVVEKPLEGRQLIQWETLIAQIPHLELF